MIKFEYFISYHYYNNDCDKGFGNIVLTLEKHIKSLDDIRDIEEVIANEPPRNNNIAVLNWKLLRKVIA
jgi:hypothetical protein